MSCGTIAWVSDSELDCGVVGGFVVGPYAVSVLLPLVNDSSVPTNTSLLDTAAAAANGTVPGDVVLALCPAGTYGEPGEACLPCPSGARCDGLFADPQSLPGWYPVDRGAFVECTPTDACVGGANVTVASAVTLGVGSPVLSCALNYQGPRCADCRYVWACGRVCLCAAVCCVQRCAVCHSVLRAAVCLVQRCVLYACVPLSCVRFCQHACVSCRESYASG